MESSYGGDLRELYQELILDHNQSPRNFRKLDDATRSAEGYNPLCGDTITVYLHLSEESSDKDVVIEDISFQGSGCAISKASASIMTAELKGKTIAEAEAVFESFRTMVTTAGDVPKDIGKLVALAGVRKYPVRVKCATLPWHTLANSLKGVNKTTTTE